MTQNADSVRVVSEALCAHRDPEVGAVEPCAACDRAAQDAVRAFTNTLPNAPLPPDTCCGNAEWRGRYCQYHQGYDDGWDALLARIGAAPIDGSDRA